MSVFRQFWFAFIACLLLACGGSLLGSILSVRSVLETQLSIHDADNAAALAWSLSQTKLDPESIELGATALFAGGHYELIRVVDAGGRTLFERAGVPLDREVPDWFVRWLPIRVEAGSARISDGRQPLATLTLSSDRGLAYGALWRNVWQTIAAFSVAMVAGGLLGSILLGRLKAPLQAVVDQATAISERRFVTIDEPRVPELKRLVQAMNAIVLRLRTHFEEDAERLEALRRQVNCDPLTGLANRSHFLACLQQTLAAEDAGQGTLLLIRVSDLATVNRRFGRTATDDFLRQTARVIAVCAAARSLGCQGLAGRLNGAEFAVILPAGRDGASVAAGLLAELVDVCQSCTAGHAVLSIGVGSYRRPTRLDDLLARVDAALVAAEGVGVNSIRQAALDDDPETPQTIGQWSQTIRRAIDAQGLRLAFFAVIDASGRLQHREGALRLQSEAGGRWMAAGCFLPFAERLRLTPELDLAAVVNGLHELRLRPETHGVAINLAASSVADAGFRQRLLDLLASQAQDAPRLWFEIAENGALRHLAAVHELSLGLKAVGSRLGLEHYGHQLSEIGRLHDLGLNYLKVDASFLRELPGNRANAAFLKGLTAIAHGIGWQVFAEGVSTPAQWRALIALGFDGATGSAIGDLPLVDDAHDRPGRCE